VEGLLRDIVSDLSLDQPLRRIQDEDGYHKIQTLIDKMREILGDDKDEEFQAETAAGKESLPMPAFTVKLDDPAGNSFIEFIGSMADPKWNLRTYPRTLQQNIALGLVAADETTEEEATKTTENQEITNDEILIFPGVCSSCGHALQTLMKRVNIPYFKVCLV
jgi:zinc finger protein